MARLRALPVLTLLLALVPLSAHAQSDDDKSAARALGMEGQDALDKKDFTTAADRFHRAVAIFDEAKAPVPLTLLLGLARADAGVNHLVSSQEAYNRLIRQGAAPGAPAVFLQAVEDAKKEIDPVAARIASVTITVTGCDSPQVAVDGSPVSAAALGVKRPTDPGTHKVSARAQGCKPGDTTFTVSDGGVATASIALVKDAPSDVVVPPPATTANPPPSTTTQPPPPAGEPEQSSGFPTKTVAIAALAVGGVGIVVGSITGGIALGDHSTLQKECSSNGVCSSTQAKNDLDGYHTMGTVSTIGFIVGGVGLVGGAAIWLLGPRPDPKSAWVMPTIGLGTIGAVGAF